MAWRTWYKKDLWIAKFLGDTVDDYDMRVSLYDTPEYIGKFNIQPLSGQSTSAFGNTIQRDFGDKVEKMQSVMLDYDKYLDMFHEDDVAWINISPDEGDTTGYSANYRIVSVRNQNKKIAIYFEKLIDKD